MARTPGKEESIREAAIRVFSRKGFYETRMEEIAQEAGVAVGTIYNYFSAKEDVLLSVFAEEFSEWMHVYEDLHARGVPIRERIHLLLEKHADLHLRHGELALVLLRERFSHGGGFQERLLAFYRGMMERIEGVIREGIEEGLIRPCDPRVVGQALFALFEVTTAVLLTYPKVEADRLLETAPQEIETLLWQGLRKEVHDAR